jgi:hypothetical protein
MPCSSGAALHCIAVARFLFRATIVRMEERSTRQILDRARRVLRLDELPNGARKIVVGIIGGLCFIAGAVMIVTPGPAFILIPLGLLLLASEFAFAERWADQALKVLRRARNRWRAWRAARKQAA